MSFAYEKSYRSVLDTGLVEPYCGMMQHLSVVEVPLALHSCDLLCVVSFSMPQKVSWMGSDGRWREEAACLGVTRRTVTKMISLSNMGQVNTFKSIL